MQERSQRVEAFVHAVHRRMVVLRALESTGVGVLMGCGVGLVFSLVLLWRGGAGAMAVAGGCVMVGALLGLGWGLSRRATEVEAAMEADRQLGLQDLLLTAVSMGAGRNEAMPDLETGGDWKASRSAGPREETGMAQAQNEAKPGQWAHQEADRTAERVGRGPGSGSIARNEPIDGFAVAVMEVAARRVREHSPSELVMNRLGVRAWGGIGLAAALVFAVAGLATQVEQGRAESGRRAFVDPRRIEDSGQNEATAAGVGGQRGDGTGGRDAERRDGDGVLLPGPVDDPMEDLTVDGGFANDSAVPGADGAGPGAARSEGEAGGGDRRRVDPAEGSADGRGTDSEGVVRSGTGGAGDADGGRAAAESAGRTTATDDAGLDVRTWRHSPSPADRDAALRAVGEGRVPDGYRDLVREYFTPQQ